MNPPQNKDWVKKMGRATQKIGKSNHFHRPALKKGKD